MPQPPEKENKPLTWPDWPLKLRTSSSQEEGAERDFAVMTQANSPARTAPSRSSDCVRVDGKLQPIPGTRVRAQGRSRAPRHGLRLAGAGRHDRALGVTLDQRGNVAADTSAYKSSLDKVFACGDMRRGQSLVVWAIREGRQAAHAVDKYLMGATDLPR